MSSGAQWAYIARSPDATKDYPAGTVVCAAVDRPERAKDNAKEVAKWMRAGLVIERVPLAWAKEFLFTTEPYRSEGAVP